MLFQTRDVLLSQRWIDQQKPIQVSICFSKIGCKNVVQDACLRCHSYCDEFLVASAHLFSFVQIRLLLEDSIFVELVTSKSADVDEIVRQYTQRTNANVFFCLNRSSSINTTSIRKTKSHIGCLSFEKSSLCHQIEF